MFGNERRDPTLIGAFDPKCDLRKVIEDAADSASHLCEKYYLGSPEVEFEIINGKFEYHKSCIIIIAHSLKTIPNQVKLMITYHLISMILYNNGKLIEHFVNQVLSFLFQNMIAATILKWATFHLTFTTSALNSSKIQCVLQSNSMGLLSPHQSKF